MDQKILGYKFGDYFLSVEDTTLSKGIISKQLTYLKYETLFRLVVNKGKFVAKEALGQVDAEGRLKEEYTNIEARISDLRIMLWCDKDNPQYIETVKTKGKAGYRFIQEVEILYEGETKTKKHESIDQAKQPELFKNIDHKISRFNRWIRNNGKYISWSLTAIILITFIISIGFFINGFAISSNNYYFDYSTYAICIGHIVLLIAAIFWQILDKVSPPKLPILKKEDNLKDLSSEEVEKQKNLKKALEMSVDYLDVDHWNSDRRSTKEAYIQFSYSWVALMLSWLFLYIIILWLKLYDIYKWDKEVDLFYVLSFFKTLLNNVATLCLLFCFYLLNRVNAVKKQLSLKISVLLVLISIISPILIYYNEMLTNSLSGIAGAIAMSMLLGRFQSQFIRPASLLLLALYIYTAIQPLFFFIGKNNDVEKEAIILHFALLLKGILILFVFWLFHSGRLYFYLLKVRKTVNDVEREWNIFQWILNK